MILWLAFLIPFLIMVLVAIFYNKKLTWWEIPLPFIITLIPILIFKFTATHSLTKDYEYWGNYVKEVRYYEAWDEYIHQTCTRTVSCGEDCTTTETYDCSYVDYHSAYWIMILNDNTSIRISKSEYNRLKSKFGNNTFQDMHRDYHHNDGDTRIL
jgi:hypothetical protein